MASLSKDSAGRWMVRICMPDGRRPTVRLGNLDADQAADVARFLSDLAVCADTGATPRPATRAWVGALGAPFLARLKRAGLLEEEGPDQAEDQASPALGPWLQTYLESRTDLKQGTRINLAQAQADLLAYFGASVRLDELTPGDAEDFRIWMESRRERPLGRGTVARRLKRARQFLSAAVKRRLLAENPFAAVKCGNYTDGRRFHFVSREEAAAVLDACPDAEWRLIFSLCRYGGLRCPSEVLGLTWADVDWARGQFAVHSPKTEQHDGGTRHVPLFPELLPHLQAAFEGAAVGQVHLVARYRGGSENLRTQMAKIIRRAGLTPWPKLFQNCRSTRETELAERFPLHVVCAWLGNSPRVASKHYLQVTEGHFRKARGEPEKEEAGALQKALHLPTTADPSESKAGLAGALQKALHLAAASDRNEPQEGEEVEEKAKYSEVSINPNDPDGTRTSPEFPKESEDSTQRAPESAPASGEADAGLAEIVEAWPSLTGAERARIVKALPQKAQVFQTHVGGHGSSAGRDGPR
jgi:integrase